MNKNTYEIQFCDLSSAPHHPGGNIAYFFFFDDTDIPLRRLLLADSLKKVTLTPYRASAWDESGVFTVRKEAMKKYPSFLHSLFSCMER